MDEQGLWALFYATGLPEVYLAIRQERADREEEAERRPGPPFAG